MRLLNNNNSTLSIINALNESLLQHRIDTTDISFEDAVNRDFNLFLDDYNINPNDVTEDDINDYFSGLFYEIENSDDLDEINRAEDFIRNKYLNINESVKSKNKDKKIEKRIIMQQGNVTCLKEGNKYLVFEDDNVNISEYDNQESAMRDCLNRCGINPDNELEEPKE